MSKQKKADIEVLKKAHDEYEKKRKEAEQFNKKLFPNGVLKGDPTAPNLPFSNPLAVMQAHLDLGRLVESSLAEKLQTILEGKEENQKATAEKRKNNTKRKIKRLFKKHNIIINGNTTASQVVNKLTEKGAKNIPDAKTIRKYLNEK